LTHKTLALIIAVFFFLCTLPAKASDIYVSAGLGVRSGSMNASVGWLPINLDGGDLGIELEYTNCGEQPEPIKNINKFVELSVLGRAKFSKHITAYGKAGMHTSRLSYNGFNDHKHTKEPWGWQVGVGVETPIMPSTYIQAQVTVFDYTQVTGVHFGGYVHSSIGLRYQF